MVLNSVRGSVNGRCCIYVIKLHCTKLFTMRQAKGQLKFATHLIHSFMMAFAGLVRSESPALDGMWRVFPGKPWAPLRNRRVMVDILDPWARWHAQSDTKIICEAKCMWKAHQERGPRRLQGQSSDRERDFRPKAIHAELDLATLGSEKANGSVLNQKRL